MCCKELHHAELGRRLWEITESPDDRKPTVFAIGNFESVFDPEAFETVMKVIHPKTREVPESVTLNMMAHIAAIVDDLQCHDAVWFVTKAWINQLKDALPDELCEELIRLLHSTL
ncbi:hypothetical protein BKA56DRAFT_623634 [Ilyonectria sp. MPI-CAGE-AT-0026]|nr:hypothetical protein BKA56DRAFT_623634 [Ilyonectria sp. MPI-CAGE-AT-0026]